MKRLIIALFALMAITTAMAASISDCYVADSCTGDLELFGTSGTANAHAYLNPSHGTHKVCCNGNNISTNNTNNSYTDIVIRLEQENNSQVQEDSGLTPLYNYSVYLSTLDQSNVSCTYTSTGNCSANQACIVKLSSTTNAHVYNCSETTVNETVCCEFGLSQSGDIPEFNLLVDKAWDVIKKIITFQKIE